MFSMCRHPCTLYIHTPLSWQARHNILSWQRMSGGRAAQVYRQTAVTITLTLKLTCVGYIAGEMFIQSQPG